MKSLKTHPTCRIGLARFAAIMLLIIALDQLSKFWVLETLGMLENPAPRVITSFFTLVMWWNKGVSFSLLTHDAISPYALVALSLIISAVLARLAMKTTLTAERIGYAMVIGGAVGNVIDRLRFGAVADFLYFHIGDLGWPAFNVADASICLGVGLLLIYLLKHPSRS